MRRATTWPGWAASLALAAAVPATAQVPANWALKVTPQHLVLSGYWLEAEHVRPGHPRQTFTLGPQLYWGLTGSPNAGRAATDPARNATVRGGGLQLQHRFYLGGTATERGVPTGFYLGYGPQVQVFRLRFENGVRWEEVSGPDGLPYLQYTIAPYHETALRYGVAGQLGYQWALGCRGLLEVYAGLGVRKTSSWSSFGASQFRSGSSDYAHEGLYVPAGFKLGVVL